jgi:F0F1-type ATP synthase membrane subunit b/b'
MVFKKGGEEMPILESIQAAEAKAEQQRSEATKKVETLLEQTKKASEEKANGLREKANSQASQIAADTTNRMAAKEKEVNSANEKKDQETADAAKRRMDTAVDFILKKVFKV